MIWRSRPLALPLTDKQLVAIQSSVISFFFNFPLLHISTQFFHFLFCLPLSPLYALFIFYSFIYSFICLLTYLSVFQDSPYQVIVTDCLDKASGYSVAMANMIAISQEVSTVPGTYRDQDNLIPIFLFYSSLFHLSQCLFFSVIPFF